MSETKKKTPSARVIAAKWIIQQLDASVYAESLEPAGLTALAGSRVNDKKSDKVCDYADKLAGKFLERMQKIVDKFESPPTKKPAPKKK